MVSFYLQTINVFVFFYVLENALSRPFLENVKFRIRNFNKQKYGHCDNYNTIKERPWELPPSQAVRFSIKKTTWNLLLPAVQFSLQ